MNIIIYSRPACTFCDQAKALLTSKNIPYTELVLNIGQIQEPGKLYVPLEHLKARLPDVKTVPQIFNGDHHIGGFTELQHWLRYD